MESLRKRCRASWKFPGKWDGSAAKENIKLDDQLSYDSSAFVNFALEITNVVHRRLDD